MTQSTTARRSRGILIVLTLAVLAWGVPPAQARPDHANSGCVLGCNMEKNACMQSARMLKLECKAGCRETAAAGELGTCRRACVAAFRSTRRESCRPVHRSCHAECVAAHRGGHGTCPSRCGQALAECARGAVADGRMCMKDCRRELDRHGCLGRCGAVVEGGTAACRSEFMDCRTDCDAGSPEGAFTDPPGHRR